MCCHIPFVLLTFIVFIYNATIIMVNKDFHKYASSLDMFLCIVISAIEIWINLLIILVIKKCYKLLSTAACIGEAGDIMPSSSVRPSVCLYVCMCNNFAWRFGGRSVLFNHSCYRCRRFVFMLHLLGETLKLINYFEIYLWTDLCDTLR